MKTQLKKGTAIEKEHSKSLKKFLKPGVNINQVAQAIAKDHLKEDKNYYKKLALIEPGLKEDKPKLVKTKPLPPYNEKGKPNFPVRNVPGVYVVLKAGAIVYAGYSKNNLYRTMYHHFQNWNDSTNQYRAIWKNLEGIKVYVIYCDSGRVAKLLENAIIIKHRPKANVNVYDGFITDEKEDKLLKEAQKAFGINVNSKEDLPF